MPPTDQIRKWMLGSGFVSNSFVSIIEFCPMFLQGYLYQIIGQVLVQNPQIISLQNCKISRSQGWPGIYKTFANHIILTTVRSGVDQRIDGQGCEVSGASVTMINAATASVQTDATIGRLKVAVGFIYCSNSLQITSQLATAWRR